MAKNPIVWWEIASADAKKTTDFLKQVFGWDCTYDEATTIYDIPVAKEDNQFQGGGVFTLLRAKLPFLTLYVRVEGIEAMAAAVEAAGGNVIEPPHEIFPGTWICLFNEPSGVTLAMLEKRKGPKPG